MSQGYDETDWFTARQIAEVVIRYRVPGHRTSESGIIRWIKEQRAGRYGWTFNGNTAQWYGEYRGATAYHWAAFRFYGALCSALQEEAKRRRSESGEAKRRAGRIAKGWKVDRPNPVLDLDLAEGELARVLAADARVDWLPPLVVRDERITRFGSVSFQGEQFFCDRLIERHGEKVCLAASHHLAGLLWVFTMQGRWKRRRYIHDRDHYIGVAEARGGAAKYEAVRS